MSSLRTTNLRKLESMTYDVLVVGGGINGAVSASCLAARGVRVGLIDKGDWASFTSQQSSNLAWGGIKYMETLEFGLVRKLCRSRNHLIRTYPATVKEIRFFAVHQRGFRHSLWKLLLGTFLYWAIGNFFTKRPRLLTRKTIAREEPIIELKNSDGGFEYSDAYLHDNDARFVWNFVRGAINHGCSATNYVEAMGAEVGPDKLWTVHARDVLTGRTFDIRTKAIINACGPFVDAVNSQWGRATSHRHVFSKGIHLIVPRLTERRRVLTFFADDGRLFFVIPMGPRTCIGTTDTRVESPYTHVTPEDRRVVLDNINKRLRLDKPLTESDVIAERCGVRPLVVNGGGAGNSDWAQLSRKHVIEVNEDLRHVSIFGGKLTDCLNVGEEVAEHIARFGIDVPFPDARWYGEPPEQTRQEFFHQAKLMDLDSHTASTSSERLSDRLWRRYGSDALGLLEDVRADPEAGEIAIEGTEYLRCEIAHIARREMIVKLEDFLRRRSKIALVVREETLRMAPGLLDACRVFFGDAAQERLDEYFSERRQGAGAQPLAPHVEQQARRQLV